MLHDQCKKQKFDLRAVLYTWSVTFCRIQNLIKRRHLYELPLTMAWITSNSDRQFYPTWWRSRNLFTFGKMTSEIKDRGLKKKIENFFSQISFKFFKSKELYFEVIAFDISYGRTCIDYRLLRMLSSASTRGTWSFFDY